MNLYNLGLTLPRPDMVLTINYNTNVTLPPLNSLLEPTLVDISYSPAASTTTKVITSSRYKPHRNQTTPKQLQILQALFKHNQYPSLDHRRSLSNQLNLSMRVIQVWFQNKRQTTKAQQIARGSSDYNFIKNTRGSSNTLIDSSSTS